MNGHHEITYKCGMYEMKFVNDQSGNWLLDTGDMSAKLKDTAVKKFEELSYLLDVHVKTNKE